ncbi:MULTISPECIES: transglutaminase-like cysteine peptidase [Rhizobium/Agrobacterium group]|uniref:Transglutaminase n=5 Tax=Rhizobium/Agrobacterium group TaxID=227290 RepID=A0AAE6BML1_AGRTU|nr:MULTISPECIES: transglutaminase-like cysteine peptidase [Rhizobium/Agrobacterium group]KNY32822.1 transglutaminase [Agrobacterium sp. SUL3]KRA63561.1 transglutaminase [Rhizobium sp. Root651]MBO0132326.1 transglutaminase-like cysteine peptidase [Agrobacterium burrii]MBP8938658.1 transglutaminase-like cysteine peptidase [Agrobacterium sp.]MCA2374484.1 transglutaminase-like cysteine peptidase [Agrobacterium tomkonis CIP 111-78]
MNNNRIVFVLIAFIVSAFAQQASASPAAVMRVIGKANPPIGHYEFCQTYQSECQATSVDTGPMKLTEERWKAMLDVNYTANTTITPMTDMEIYGVEERWAYPTTVGDCEDFVLLKRKMLMNKGFSASNLLITVVLQPNGEGHAVLTVRTDRGDFVLDNMRNKVMNWSETEYTYLKRQDTANPGRWVKIQDGRATNAVGGIR